MTDKIQDLNLPNAVVVRLIKEALPDGINVGKEARSAIARAASIFGKFQNISIFDFHSDSPAFQQFCTSHRQQLSSQKNRNTRRCRRTMYLKRSKRLSLRILWSHCATNWRPFDGRTKRRRARRAMVSTLPSQARPQRQRSDTKTQIVLPIWKNKYAMISM